MSDCLIVGGGVVGLSLAYELSGHGLRVQVLDAAQAGQAASWAGAGILPPASADAPDPLEQLTALSNRLHRQWSDELREATAIDNGYARCGAIYLARDDEEAARLRYFAHLASLRKIVAQPIERDELVMLEPHLRPAHPLTAAYLVPDEHQLRNPRHVKALTLACVARGVEIIPHAAAEQFEIRRQRIVAVHTPRGDFAADQICLSSGCWSAAIAAKLGLSLEIKPIRGQIVLLSQAQRTITRIINEGPRYLVPRTDGRLLIGSTEEDVGFDRTTTAGAAAGLLDFALSLAPDLGAASIERSWSGLRPATADGLPYLGRIGQLENAFVAAGHFRSGLQQSTGTARVVGQLIRGLEPEIDLTAFRPDRPRTLTAAATGGAAAGSHRAAT